VADEVDPEKMCCLWGGVELRGSNAIQLSAQGMPGCAVSLGIYPMRSRKQAVRAGLPAHRPATRLRDCTRGYAVLDRQSREAH
jgi:hypothetical protein